MAFNTLLLASLRSVQTTMFSKSASLSETVSLQKPIVDMWLSENIPDTHYAHIQTPLHSYTYMFL